MDALRFSLKKDGIYDTGTQEFNAEHLKKAKAKYSNDPTIKRLFDNFDEKDLMDIMNVIAKNGKSSKSDTA
jgi:hypothetical protein